VRAARCCACGTRSARARPPGLARPAGVCAIKHLGRAYSVGDLNVGIMGFNMEEGVWGVASDSYRLTSTARALPRDRTRPLCALTPDRAHAMIKPG